MNELANESLHYASSYLKTVHASRNATIRRFDNDLLYNLIAVCFEKFMVALLAHHDIIPNSHLPILLYNEAKAHETTLSDSIRHTAKLIGSYESICSIDGFGYHTPDDTAIDQMVKGLEELQEVVHACMTERIA